MRIWDIHPIDSTVIDPAGREAPVDPMRHEPRIPAGATSIEPPEVGEHETARWAGEAWEVVADWRGNEYWTEDGKHHEITELGVKPPSDALNEMPPESLDLLAARKRRAIDQARDQAFAAGLPYDFDGHIDVVQTRPQDQINLLGLSAKAQRLIADGEAAPVMRFRGQSNETRMLTPEQMNTLTMTALNHIESIYQRSWECKDAISRALETQDRETLHTIKW
ncbi:DUF4376 domain-containing protein [Halomonas sp. MCCC 1A17488]|uniref:DUF4376 domain-containing protein n=1 Tax=unclassified Halomonas TaxID=2609666 RepID=UPI0018D240D7|nr:MULTISPECIES: DUF4376 domain-containing protein [unclassified Halomonas]MCE8015917.1 DUF4376 domain-containing protein [Halomonas sp. MCCC 1A17488]MCG3239250.1 DUF4376 domain-containing protein [Halomonas sp. MCCC 1A17488]QPP50815.1 DUF4376 domain-containing protein [Halomonas sp. SS10-MC5]